MPQRPSGDTLLLIHGDGINNDSTIRDQKNGKITLVSGAAYSTTNKKYGVGSIDFDGTDDYISITSSLIFPITGWSIDFWYYPTEVRVNDGLITFYQDGSNFISTWVNTTGGQIYFAYRTDGTYHVNNGTTGLTLTAGNWYHLGFQFSGSVAKTVVNGTAYYTSDSFTPASITTTVNKIGYASGSDGYLKGSVSEFIARNTFVDFTSSTSLSSYNSGVPYRGRKGWY